MKKENTYLPSAKKIFQRYERVSFQENILLVGTVGAGKSATINTISAALSGEKKYRAPIGSHLSSPDAKRKRTTTHLMW
jgi:predicted GTPase